MERFWKEGFIFGVLGDLDLGIVQDLLVSLGAELGLIGFRGQQKLLTLRVGLTAQATRAQAMNAALRRSRTRLVKK